MGYLHVNARIGSALAPWVAKWLQIFHVALPFSLMGEVRHLLLGCYCSCCQKQRTAKQLIPLMINLSNRKQKQTLWLEIMRRTLQFNHELTLFNTLLRWGHYFVAYILVVY